MFITLSLAISVFAQAALFCEDDTFFLIIFNLGFRVNLLLVTLTYFYFIPFKWTLVSSVFRW